MHVNACKRFLNERTFESKNVTCFIENVYYVRVCCDDCRCRVVVAVFADADRRSDRVSRLARRPRRRRRGRSRLRGSRRVARRRSLQRRHVGAQAPSSGARTPLADRPRRVRVPVRRRTVHSVRRRLAGMPNPPRRRRSGVSATRPRRRLDGGVERELRGR